MTSERARRLLRTGRPAYVRAFGRMVAGEHLTIPDRRALATGRQGSGYAVPPQFDPTIVVKS